MNDLVVEKNFVGTNPSGTNIWVEVNDVERELKRLEAYFQDPGLLMYVGSRFRTPWAFYRVSDRRRRQELTGLAA